MGRWCYALAALGCALVCAGCGWTPREKSLIGSEGRVLRVLTVVSEEDSLLLRRHSRDMSVRMLASDTYDKLAWDLVATVCSPEQDGVGIAGPQVGILRRVVAVQRFDMEGEPFKVYPNIRIIDKRGPLEPGPEGCLSVPDRRGTVLRYRDITISYTSPATLRDTTEDVSGFTAVIFQHETDHLDGILYTDRIR